MERTFTLQLERKQFSELDRIAKHEHRTTENLIEHLILQKLRYTAQRSYHARMQAETEQLFEMPDEKTDGEK